MIYTVYRHARALVHEKVQKEVRPPASFAISKDNVKENPCNRRRKVICLMSYSKDYDRLLTPDGYEKLRKRIDDGKIIPDYRTLEFKMAQHDDLKYFSAVIDTDKDEVTFCAYLLVTYLEKDLLFPHVKDKDFFPVMIIVTPSKIEKTAADLNDKDITLKHELLHLSDLRDIFDKEPSFIMKGCRNALVNAGISENSEQNN